MKSSKHFKNVSMEQRSCGSLHNSTHTRNGPGMKKKKLVNLENVSGIGNKTVIRNVFFVWFNRRRHTYRRTEHLPASTHHFPQTPKCSAQRLGIMRRTTTRPAKGKEKRKEEKEKKRKKENLSSSVE